MSIQITVLLFVTITLLVASPINANSTRADYETTKDDYYSGNSTTLGSTTIASKTNGTNYFNSTTLSTPTGNSSIINGTIASKKNGTILGSYYYNTSTTLQSPTGNFSTFNGTSAPNRNKTYTPSYYHTSTTLQAPTGNFSTINGTFVPKRNQTYYYTLTPYLSAINGTFEPKKNQTYYFTVTRNILSAELDTTTAQPQSTPSFGRYQVENNKTDDDEYNEKKAIMEKRLESLLERSQFPKFMNDPYDYNNTSNDTKDPELTLKLRIEFEPQETTTATPDFSDNQMLNETINLTGKQYPNKFQVLFDLWLLDSGNGDNMGKVDWNNLSMSEIPEIIYDDYTLVQKKQTILNTFNVLSKFIEQYVSTDQPGSGSLLRFFNGSTTMQDLVMIANVKNFIQLNGTTDETTSITNSDQKEMGKHGQKVFRKIYTYTEEEITTQ